MKKTILILIIFFTNLGLSQSQTQITGFSPANIIGGIGQVLTISGSGFGSQRGDNYVSFLQTSGTYMDSSTGRATNYLSWSDTKIELEMPLAYSENIHVNIGGIDYSSTDSLHVKANLGYRTTNPLEYIYLTNKNGNGGYTFYMHRSYWDNPEIKAAIEDVFREFRCKTGVNYILAGEPSDATLNLGDTINLIGPDSTMGAAGYMNMLWGSCILGDVTFYQWNSMDLHMSSKLDWYYGKGKVTEWKAKFRYVMMHELGHSVGLGHVNEYGQTMYPIVTNLPVNAWNGRDSITTEEQIAMSYYVGLSQKFTFNACGITPMAKIKNCEDVYGITSVNDLADNAGQFNVYPNPSNGKFKIDFSENSVNLVNLEIYSILGEKILERKDFDLQNANEINISDFSKGIYLIIIKDKGKVSTKKLVVE